MMPILGTALYPMVEQGIKNRYSRDPSELNNFTAGGCAHHIGVVHSSSMSVAHILGSPQAEVAPHEMKHCTESI